MRPIIGITTYVEPASWGVWHDLDTTLVPHAYTEAVEDPAHRFVLGVQWHPEVSRDRRLFGALLAAARA